MSTLKARLAARERIIGTWVKTPSPIVVEVLSDTELGVLCLDAEHAPFGRVELDACVHAARAGSMDTIIRVEAAQPHYVLQALDYGATGVVIPHVLDADGAAAAVQMAHFGPGGRGYAGSTRAAGYTTVAMADHKANAAGQTVVIVQIEDAEAIEHAGAIAATPGLDAVFIGPVDLSVSLGAAGPTDPVVTAAVERIAAAAVEANRSVGIFANTADQRRAYEAMGINLFLMQSDHTFLRRGAAALLD